MVGGRLLVSDGDWRQLSTVVQLFPAPVVRAPVDTSARGPAVVVRNAALVEEFPWLADSSANKRAGNGAGSGARSSSDPKPCAKGDNADGDSDESDLDHMEIDAAEEAFDVDVEQVAAMLAAKKVETIKAGAEAEGPFAWRVMGGSWAKAHLGVDYDAFRAEVRTPRARAWLVQYSLPASASFTLAVYGEQLARILAEYWTSNMTFFYNGWLFWGAGARVFSDEEVSAFAEPRGFVDAFAAADGRILARMKSLRELRPS